MEYRPKRQRPDVQASDAEERREKRLLTPEHRSPHNRSGAPSEALCKSNEPGVRLAFYGQGIQNSGSFQVGGNLNIGVQDNNSDKDAEFLATLRSTDPSDDRMRIQREKGGLLEDSYSWILDHADFRRWRDDEQSRLLWIKGDPGKGKTMLLCGIIQELEKLPADTRRLSYFFCQATDVRLSNATSVLRGLLYLLLDQEPSLMSHVRKKFAHAGKQLFEDVNQWDALSKILINILQDSSRPNTFLVIDALDECEMNRDQLLELLVQISSSYSAKLIVSSRNWPCIEKALRASTQKLRICLELNHESISSAVSRYIDYKVDELTQSNNYDGKTQDAVRHHLASNANDTFLWVALACEELRKVETWDVLDIIKEVPAGLEDLYDRMMQQVQRLGRRDQEWCRSVLSAVTTAYRPLHQEELGYLSSLPWNIQRMNDHMSTVTGMCGSFLTIRDNVVYIIHQSAKDFLSSNKYIFPSGMRDQHHVMFSRSLEILSRTLRRNIYSLRAPGYPIDQVTPPVHDPLASIRYSCIYWADHLSDAISHATSEPIGDLRDDGTVHQFLSKKYLYWLEALGLLRGIPEGVIAMTKLEALLEEYDKPRFFSLIRDARRFILSHGWAIGNAPLQAYASALTFSPRRSITRKLFEEEEPYWVVMKPAMAEDWDACMATLEGHSGYIESLAFSPDGQCLATASWDGTIKVWDTTTCHCHATLEGHCDTVYSVNFSPDGQYLASGSRDKTIRIWDARTGHCQAALKGHGESVESVAFSPDGQCLATASWDKTIKIWDARTGHCHATLKGHGELVRSVAFSPDGQCLASASRDKTVKIWDTATGHCQATLNGHHEWVKSVAFSPDGQRLASASGDGTIKVWDVRTGHCQATLEDHREPVNSVSFSPDGQHLASASWDKTVKIWDTATGHCQATLEGHREPVNSVSFSPNGQHLASASEDEIIKIWNARTGHYEATVEGHSDYIDSLAFSPDGQYLASASRDETIKIWDTATGHCQVTLEGHHWWVYSVSFSPNGQHLASASWDETVKIWDARTGHCQATLKGHDGWVNSVAFSPDGQYLASASRDKTIKIWDARTGHCQATLKGHGEPVKSVAFSPDSQYLASASDKKVIKIWDATTGRSHATFMGHGDTVLSVAFSPDSQLLASASRDETIKIWDATTGHCQATLYVGRSLYTIRFDEIGSRLLTDAGTFDLSMPSASPSPTVALPVSGFLYRPVQSQGYGISADGIWITYKGRNLLWLPSEYRPAISAIAASTVALSCNSGQVWSVRFLRFLE